MNFSIENTKGWSEKCWFSIGRNYNLFGEFEGVFLDFCIWRIGWWKD